MFTSPGICIIIDLETYKTYIIIVLYDAKIQSMFEYNSIQQIYVKSMQLKNWRKHNVLLLANQEFHCHQLRSNTVLDSQVLSPSYIIIAPVTSPSSAVDKSARQSTRRAIVIHCHSHCHSCDMSSSYYAHKGKFRSTDHTPSVPTGLLVSHNCLNVVKSGIYSPWMHTPWWMWPEHNKHVPNCGWCTW